jgi:molybdopterin/thiamine biosynthesis adenylyltransferase
MAETADADGLDDSSLAGRPGQDLVDDQVIDLTDRSSRPLATYTEEATGLRIEVHRPLESQRRWRQYLDGAEARYSAYGVAEVLGRADLEDGRSTSLFFVAVDEDDAVVAGLRCHGPLTSVDDAYATDELRGHPRMRAVRELLDRTVPSGLVEIKGVWVDRRTSSAAVTDAIARCYVHAMTWFGTRFAMCTCADTVAPRWKSTGGRPFLDLEAVPFPNEDYRTVLLLWDREHLPERVSNDQWAAIVRETDSLKARPAITIETAPDHGGILGPEWQAEVLDERRVSDAVRILELQADPGIEVLDRLGDQLRALRAVRTEIPVDPDAEGARWAYYPWRRSLVRLLGPTAFRTLRLDRNRNKLTAAEQADLGQLTVGVIGLSVGHAIAHALALEGTCGHLRLADFDHLELSNLNRIPATVLDLGLNKAVIVSRRIAELDPYLEIEVIPEGLDGDTLDAFVTGLDILVEECDSLDVKALVREAARAQRVPVLMETSDRGLLDVERFDLEPDRPIFHGLLGDVDAAELKGLTTHDKVPHVLRILEPDHLSSRMAASMAEIDETLTTWPQLAGDVLLGAASIAAAVRAIGRGDPLPSGRARVDLDRVVHSVTQPPAPFEAPPVPTSQPSTTPPADPVLAVCEAATLAPSGGNAQPWRLEPTDRGFDIHLDEGRTSSMDVAFRGSYVAIGAATLNARIAAAAHGLRIDVLPFPDGADGSVVSRIELTESDAGPRMEDLYRLVLTRSTNRHPGDGRPIDQDAIETIQAAVQAEGARLHLLTDRDAITEYAELLAESDRLRFLTPHLHQEMMGELRWPGIDGLQDGIDVRTLELDDSDLAKLAVARRSDVMAQLAAWDGGRALGDTSRERVPTSSAIAVVTVGDSSPASYVRGGAAVQRLWLEATGAGLSVQPVSPVSVFALDDHDFEGLVPPPRTGELKAITSGIRELLGLSDDEVVALFVRLSHAAPPSLRSERFPLGGAGVLGVT